MEILKAITSNKKEVVNAINSRDSMKKHKNEEIIINGIVIFKDNDKTISSIKTSDDRYFSSVSESVKETLNTICSIFTKEQILEGIKVRIKNKMSRNDREYLIIELI